MPAAVTASGTIPTGYLILNVEAPRRGIQLADRGRRVRRQNRLLRGHARHQPTGPDQAAVTLGNTDGEIAGLTISDPPTQPEVQALRDKCEELADDVRTLSILVHALRTALLNAGLIKGSA